MSYLEAAARCGPWKVYGRLLLLRVWHCPAVAPWGRVNQVAGVRPADAGRVVLDVPGYPLVFELDPGETMTIVRGQGAKPSPAR